MPQTPAYAGFYFWTSMGWRIIEILTGEFVQLYLNNIMIVRTNEKILINISEIDTLIIDNIRCIFTLNLINALSHQNVNIILMNNSHIPSSYIIPVQGHHSSLKILRQQMNWSHSYKSKLWTDIILNKIKNQTRCLDVCNILYSKEYFENIMNNIKPYDITNREGHAAKVYWHILFGKSFIRDQKAKSNTIINSMLNYGYAIIRSLVIKSIIKKGLDPRLSVFHKSFTNYFALASDYMEPFRPLVDNIVYQFRDSKFFTMKIRDVILSVLESRVKIGSKHYYINLSMEKIIDSIIKGEGWVTLDLWD